MIRELTERDLEEVSVLLQQLSPYPVKPDREKLRTKILEIAASGYIKVFGYECAGRIIGMCTVGRIEGLSKGCRPFAVIENVVVDAAMHRKGVGTQLVRHAMAQAEQWNCYKVVLESGTKDEGKLGFYEQCGLTRGEKTAFIKRF